MNINKKNDSVFENIKRTIYSIMKEEYYSEMKKESKCWNRRKDSFDNVKLNKKKQNMKVKYKIEILKNEITDNKNIIKNG